MGIVDNALIGASGQGGGYNLTRSLRFRSSASAYLNRTPATTTNQQTFTLSFWVKRGSIGSDQTLFCFGNGGGTGLTFEVYWGTSGTQLVARTLNIGVSAPWQLDTTQVFRDPSAWYHVVIAVDTPQATASNRVKIYVNGSQVTAFSVSSYPSQNYNTGANTNTQHRIGTRADGIQYTDGYLTEVNFIDGQALTPSSFGSTNALTGVWQPARYTGTYGTNGFYLPFTDNSALTTSSNVGLGRDYSGNSNYWTTNNISITAGTTYDSMTDVPTLTSATAANYCVINPLDKGNTPSRLTISNGNLTATWDTTAGSCASLASVAVSSGKWYWEATFVSGNYGTAGILKVGDSKLNYIGSTSGGYSYANDGNKVNNGSFTAYGASYTSGDVIGIALDLTAGTLVFYKNGVSQGTAFSGISGLYQPALSDVAFAALVYTLNFGQRPFTYTPPTGFVALNTFNLPTSTIVKGNTVMDATLYTGTGASLSVTNAASFKPDLVWVKSRSAATDHELTDSVRGVTKSLSSNLSAAEATDVQGLTAFNSNGFTVGTNTNYNNLTATYVAWQWQAGQGSSSSNTNGTITSTVSVNASAGFSVATYTGNGTAGATIGHSLGVAPSWIITKSRSNAGENWICYHVSLGGTKGLVLDGGNAAITSAGYWNNTNPSSSVITLGNTATNTSGYTYIAYSWAPIAGYSAFGSYTGNGSSDGPFIYLGFRPRWVLIKRTDASTNWILYDTARNLYNVTDLILSPNAPNAEASGISFPHAIDCLSNGFKTRNYDATYGPNINASGGTYMYACFAENPFKNALAR
jgi:hypothetical protein